MISKNQAIEIAVEQLAKHNYTVSEFDITPDAEDATGEYWMVWFDKKGPFPLPGGCGVVRVSKMTGDAQLLPGE